MLVCGAIIAISPFERPDVALVASLSRAGAVGVLDLGHDAEAARAAVKRLAATTEAFGVRFGDLRVPLDMDLPRQVRWVVVPAALGKFSFAGRTVVVQVTSIDEARRAAAAGVNALIAKGSEAGGAVGDETAFVLLQRILGELAVPTWVQGGIGLHSAAAAIAAGASGIVLDSQLALLEDATTSEDLRQAIGSMDGSSETAVHQGVRRYRRQGAGDAWMLGQDAALARPLAERCATASRLVRAFRTAVEGHLVQARSLRPLAPGAPLALALGARYPIVQGPMTRVSDRPAFAAAVAEGGAIPFLALSLLRGAQAEGLLEQTKASLGSRPWGVGILGFVPPDLREEQLDLLRRVRPPLAIVAGGRPAQAQVLEGVGIRTFLHVPSPGLLDLFFADGARRFVFEGRECGGHVGPRSSFVLWDMIVDSLLAKGRLDEVEVLFAGGIHDARSAAAVAALAAPLAARGAKIGVLMGTAYLFTEEAVSTGAIGEVFQEEALRCERTALLETGPGHATRCVENDYVQAFASERSRLEGEGLPAEEVWSALEKLNLGRLRLAAKGIWRESDELLSVTPAEQQREGMFMIGQVAALRHSRLMIRELHAEVSERGSAHLEANAARWDAIRSATAEMSSLAAAARHSDVDIAIVGMACMFPDAPDTASFWSNIVFGRDAIREVPPDRWNHETYWDKAGTGVKTPSKWGGFLPTIVFDPSKYGIPPRSLGAVDPVQLLSLEVARRSLVDAGYATLGATGRAFDRERVGVVFGAEAGADLAHAYSFRAHFAKYLGEMPPALDASLPKLTEDSFPGVLGNVIAGRIANRLDLRGVNFTIDAACASSLAAVDTACKELICHSSDMVIAGGADLHNSVYDYLLFASVHALSPTGACRPFDQRADGIALGEGVAAIVLKRLSDAERDGDRVYAVIRGVGGSSDGKSMGLTAPRKEGQLRALERAYDRAGFSPAEVGLVEAHGTGTIVGDRTELATLTEFFEAAGAGTHGCTLGSVKSQIGHTKCAAGMAGLIKATLSIYHGVLPATPNIEIPNLAYDERSSPFVLRSRAAPWLSPARTAAVSAFGFGGTNFHLVLSGRGSTGAEPVLTDWPAELFVLHGEDRNEALSGLDLVARVAKTDCPPALRDLAAAAAAHLSTKPVQLAIVATSLSDLLKKAAAARSGQPMPNVFERSPLEGRVAFLFPGQGSQRPSMLADLFVAFPRLREWLSRGSRFMDRLFPSAAFSDENRTQQERAVTDTTVAQPALGLAGLAMTQLLGEFGISPDMAGGHSYGELVALAAAGSFDPETLIELSDARARAMTKAGGKAPGTMAAVRASAEEVQRILGAVPVTLANLNAPDQVVIAGTREMIARSMEALAEAGVAAKELPVASAFHSPIVAAASAAFAEALAAADVRSPRFPVFANTTASRYKEDPDQIREQLANQIKSPVRFAEEILAMYDAGARVFVEAGPGGVLTDLVRRILGSRPHLAVACDRAGANGIETLLTALGALSGAGVHVDIAPLFAGRAEPAELANATRYNAPSTAWYVNGGRAWPVAGELPEFAMRPLAAPVALASQESEGEAAVRDYLRLTRELAENQRRVMLRYLGAESGQADHGSIEVRELALPQASVMAPSQEVSQVGSAGSAGQDDATNGMTPSDGSAQPTVWQVLLQTVSERTGYPTDVLEPQLNLEADLGIDSIKRVEIIGAMRDKLGLGKVKGSTDLLEELSKAKTLRHLADGLEGRLSSGDAQAAASVPPASANGSIPHAGTHATSAGTPPNDAVHRYIIEPHPIAPAQANGVTVTGQSFAITADPFGVAHELGQLLEAKGASVRVVHGDEELGRIQGLIHLATLAEVADPARSLFTRTKQATAAGARWIMVGTGLGGRFGHGLPGSARADIVGASGLLKSLNKELTSLRARAVDLSPNEDPKELAQHLLRELVAADRHVEVGYAGGQRYTLVAREAAGLGQDPNQARAASSLIDEHSVVLLSGGGRGITSLVARALARRFRCTLELVGRSEPRGEEDNEIAQARDLESLRGLLVRRARSAGERQPSEIERACRSILAAREIRDTLADCRRAGARVEYHAVDVSNEAEFGALIDRLRERHGRIDGVIHGAGAIEDKLFADKEVDSFLRVYRTKVVGALTLAEKLASVARFFVFFSSVSGAFGNRGQTDYAAANDVLDKLARRLHAADGVRTVSINWGPWRGGGMVRPELEREYDRRGVGMISPHDGVMSFLDELEQGADPQVVLTAVTPEGFG